MLNYTYKHILLVMVIVAATVGEQGVCFGNQRLGNLDLEWQSEWSNRHISEGVDDDPDSAGFWFNTLTASYGDYTFGGWYAQSLRGSAYNEVNLFAEYGISLGDLTLFGGVTWLTFPAPADVNTWELYLGFEYEVQSRLTFFGEAFYDIDDIRGGFIELGIASVLPTDGFDERLDIVPYGLIGIDFGYVSGPRRIKGNNLQFGLEASYAVDTNWEVIGSINHSFRLSNLRAQGEGDVSWVSAGLVFRF
jgi:hypothetical protein